MSGFTANLLTGVAELLDTDGVGTWSPSAAYAAADTAISLINLPQAPDKVVCLADYRVTADPALTDSVIGLQVRIRGDRDPRTVMNLSEAVYDCLHGLTHAQLGTAPNRVQVVRIAWQSESTLGPDANGRHERSINFYVMVNRPDPTGRLE